MEWTVEEQRIAARGFKVDNFRRLLQKGRRRNARLHHSSEGQAGKQHELKGRDDDDMNVLID